MLQAILVTRRILFRTNTKGFVHVYHLWDSFQLLPPSVPSHRFTELLNIYRIMLEEVRFFPQRDARLCSTFIEIIDLLVFFMKTLNDEEQSPIVNSESLKHSLELISDIDQFHLPGMDGNLLVDWFAHWNWHIQPMIYELLTILSVNPEMITYEIKSCFHQVVKRDGCDR